jgi:hypothetical protein
VKGSIDLCCSSHVTEKNKIPKRGSLDHELRTGVFEFYYVGEFPRSTDFSVLQNVQTGSTAHPVTYLMDTGNFPGVKRMALDFNRSTPPSAKVKNKWSYSSTVAICLHGADGKTFAFTC